MSVTTINITPETPITVLSIADAKAQLRIESSFTDEDDLIQSYIDTAIANCENYMNAHIQPKEMVVQMSAFQNYDFETCPITSITVEYYKQDEDSLTTLSASDYYTESTNTKKVKLVIDNEPTDVDNDRPDAVVITCALGYDDADDIPTPIIQAIKLQISDMYERREDRAEIPIKASQGLLRPYRNYL